MPWCKRVPLRGCTASLVFTVRCWKPRFPVSKLNSNVRDWSRTYQTTFSLLPVRARAKYADLTNLFFRQVNSLCSSVFFSEHSVSAQPCKGERLQQIFFIAIYRYAYLPPWPDKQSKHDQLTVLLYKAALQRLLLHPITEISHFLQLHRQICGSHISPPSRIRVA